MRIGVLNISKDSRAGGTHTLTSSIHAALVESAPDTAHTFVLFTADPSLLGSAVARNVEYHYLDPSPGHLLAGAARAASRAVRAKIGNPTGPLDLLGAEFGYHQAVFNQSGVDLVWSLTGGIPPVDIPYVPTILDLQHRRQPFFPEASREGEWAFRERHFTRIIQRSAMVFVGTNEGKAEVESFYGYPPERVKVIPLPTPQMALQMPTDRRAATVRDLGLAPGYLFYPAQFWPHKNHTCLLRAVRLLRDRGRVLTLVLVGSDKGNQAHVERIAAELGIASQVRMLGFVSIAEMVTLYRNALALTFPTYFGPDNLPPLEAFALECPVIASRVPGAVEQLGEAALLFDPGDHVALADAVELVASDAITRARLIEGGKVRAARFTSRDYVAEALRHFDEFECVRTTWPSG